MTVLDFTLCVYAVVVLTTLEILVARVERLDALPSDAPALAAEVRRLRELLAGGK